MTKDLCHTILEDRYENIQILFSYIFKSICIALFAIPSQVFAAFPGVNGKIVFETNRNGNSEIFTMNPDGSNQTNLTNSITAGDFVPEWSPDGTKIVFASNRPGTGNHQIYVMNADGSNVTRLTNNTSFDDHPDWSPDGTKIAFESTRAGGVEIFVMNADGTNQTQLTFTSSSGVENFSANWSPDGTKIAFERQHVGGPLGNVREIFVMNADGTNQINLTNNGVFNANPDWSPDGTKIVYRSGTNFCITTCNIFVMNANGSNQTNITNSIARNEVPSWSPDGTKIVFQSNRDTSQPQIYTMNADGSGVARITFDSATDGIADWGPQSIIQVTIVVKPGTQQPAPVNPNSLGQIPVAILSTNTFDATTVDPTTVKFGVTGTEASPVHNSLQDVNGDGLTDMLLQFNTQNTGVVCGTTSVTLTGKTITGQLIKGSASISTVGCI